MRTAPQAFFALLLLLVPPTPATSQDTYPGSEFSTMTDVRLWAEVVNCQSRDELAELINRIPISVMARHAEEADKNPTLQPNFGNLVRQVLWTEFSATADRKRLDKVQTWQDSSNQFRFDASILDITDTHVVLQPENGAPVTVPIEKLAASSQTPLRYYQRLRSRLIERLPADGNVMVALATKLRSAIKMMPSKGAEPVNRPGAATNLARAEQIAVVWALASLDQIFLDGEYLLKAAGFAEFAGMTKTLAAGYLQGIDTHRPSGALLSFRGDRQHQMIFLPVGDIDNLLDTLRTNLNMDVKLVPDGQRRLLKAQVPFVGQLVATEKDGWLFISDSQESLDYLPADPAALVAPLVERYLISTSVFVQNVPVPVREQLMTLAGRFQQESSPLMVFNLPLVMLSEALRTDQLGMHYAKDLTYESENLTIGWGVDPEGKRVFLEFATTALEGSRLAKRIAAAGSRKSKFSGFCRAESAVSMRWAANLIEEDKAQLITSSELFKQGLLKTLDESEAVDVVKQVVSLWLDELPLTIRNGQMDAASSLILSGNKVDFILALYADDGFRIEGTIQDLVRRIGKATGQEVDLQLNAETFNETKFHLLRVPIPDDIPEVRQALGAEAVFAVGVAAEAVYLAIGPDPIGALKAAIQASSEPDAPEFTGVQQLLAMQPIFEFAATLQDEELPSLMSDSLKESGLDKMILSSQTNDRTQTIQLEVQEGLLRLIRVVANYQYGIRSGDF